MNDKQYQEKIHDLTTNVCNNLWELMDTIQSDQEEIAGVYEWLCNWARLFEDKLDPDDEEN